MECARRETTLAKALKARIQSEGSMTFHDFMSAALYDPVYGFYTQGPGIGTEDGTFDTNAKYRAFAFALAHGIAQAQSSIGEPIRIVELGGGTGQLAVDILSLFPGSPPPYFVVEPSEGLRAKQAARGLQVVSDLSELSPCPAFVFGNEVLDALPVHRVMGDGEGGIRELFVGLDQEGEFVEQLDQPSTSQLAQRLSSVSITLGRGQIAEINLALTELVKKAAQVVSKGYLVFIDYGEEARKLYGYMRRNGTLRCFKSQQQVFDPFDCVGEQDLTADVDFTAVEEAAYEAKLVKVGVISQGRWLKNLGIDQYSERAHQDRNFLDEITRLTKASLLGSTFDVLGFKTPGLPDTPGFSNQ